jgi:hypothetical protein
MSHCNSGNLHSCEQTSGICPRAAKDEAQKAGETLTVPGAVTSTEALDAKGSGKLFNCCYLSAGLRVLCCRGGTDTR